MILSEMKKDRQKYLINNKLINQYFQKHLLRHKNVHRILIISQMILQII